MSYGFSNKENSKSAANFNQLLRGTPFAIASTWEDDRVADFYCVDYVDGSSDHVFNTDLDLLPSVFFNRLLDLRANKKKTTRTLSGGCSIFRTSSTVQRVNLAKFMNASIGSKVEMRFLESYKNSGGQMTVLLSAPPFSL